MEYYTILTKIGIAKFIAARASGNGVNLKNFKLSSKVILPNEDMQSLEEIVYEANISSKSVDESNPNYVNLMCHVPSDIGGFEVNAVGIYDEVGDLLAVGNLPRTYKPILKEGSAKELMIKIVMELSNAEEVILKLDPSVIMASRDYVDAIKVELNLKIDALTQKYDAEFKKVWDEFSKYLLESKFDTEIAKYVTLTTDQNINGIKNFTKLPTSNLQASKDEEFVNLSTLKKQVPNLAGGLGVNQTWQNVSRNFNVTYTNNTNKPIVAIFEAFLKGYNFSCSTQFLIICEPSGDGTKYYGIGIIPPNEQYQISSKRGSGLYPSISINYFKELR
ncbi:phage tail protein [Campylobacter jejuni]|uniref:phage tail protein n=1 Tax=Campylobacter jejuni TaxID=197 RepID=UPI0013773A5E|nr:phage tail protein [Campylobacter jejuni]NBE34219.1 phage tail protein [Campylobacter jejuni]NBE86469.1 phage tail protein [Campylobacter jejuni]